MSQILVVPSPRYVRNKNRSEINLGMAFSQSSPSLHQPRVNPRQALPNPRLVRIRLSNPHVPGLNRLTSCNRPRLTGPFPAAPMRVQVGRMRDRSQNISHHLGNVDGEIAVET